MLVLRTGLVYYIRLAPSLFGLRAECKPNTRSGDFNAEVQANIFACQQHIGWLSTEGV